MHFPFFLMVGGGFPLINKIKTQSHAQKLENFEKPEGLSYQRSCWRHLLCFRKQRQLGKMNIHWNLYLSGAHGSSFSMKSSAAERLHLTPEWSFTWTDLVTFFSWEIRRKNQSGRPWKGENHGEGWTRSHGECQLSSFWHKRLCTVIKMWG